MNPLLQLLPTVPDGSAYVLVALVVALVVVTGAIATFLEDSPAGQEWMRRYVLWRLAGTRLAKMLERRGIAAEEYVNAQTIGAVQRQLHRCRRCSRQDVCDAALAYVGPRQKRLAFCPNRRQMDGFSPLKH